MNIDGKEYITIREASVLLGRSVAQIGCYVKDGTVATTHKVDNRRLILKSEVEALERPPIPDNLGMEIDGRIYLTVAEACTALNLSPRQVFLYIQKGVLANTVRIGGRRGACRLILKTDLEELKPRLRKKRAKKGK